MQTGNFSLSIRYPSLPYPYLPYPVQPYLPYHILSYPKLPSLTLSYHVLPTVLVFFFSQKICNTIISRPHLKNLLVAVDC